MTLVERLQSLHKWCLENDRTDLGILCEAAEELDRLQGQLEPEITGMSSLEQQARAWRSVWKAMWDMGMCSFLPDPIFGPSDQRVIQFVQSLKEESCTSW